MNRHQPWERREGTQKDEDKRTHSRATCRRIESEAEVTGTLFSADTVKEDDGSQA